jgi:NAD(P)-dependent dehydrogenase (short-subunit alcohol dehydrogenase family)
LEDGWHIIAVDLLKPKNLYECVDFIQFDLSEIQKYDQLAAKINALTKNLKALINNAGINAHVERAFEDSNKFENTRLDEWDYQMRVNLTAPVFLTKELLSSFCHQDKKPCKVVNVTSMYGVVAPNHEIYSLKVGAKVTRQYKPIAYPVSKAALDMATRYLATYLATRGINVNSIAPGGIENGAQPEFIENYGKLSPMKRMANVDEMSEAFKFLLGSGSNYMCGHTLIIDGGWSVW